MYLGQLYHHLNGSNFLTFHRASPKLSRENYRLGKAIEHKEFGMYTILNVQSHRHIQFGL